MTRASLFLIGGLALCAACEPVHLQEDHRNRNAAAATGAVLGGIAGGLAGDSGAAIAIGAVAGGLVGAGIGDALDRQAADLRNDIGNDQVTVTNTGESLLVSFPQDILFATDSAAVSGSSRDELRGLAANLQQYPDTNVQVVGHTDNTGAAGYNFDLSTRRAGAVSAVLVDGGVSSGRISATGRGEDQPIASNLTPEGRAQNRRVEVIIRPTA